MKEVRDLSEVARDGDPLRTPWNGVLATDAGYVVIQRQGASTVPGDTTQGDLPLG